MPELLIELLSEEIPARMQPRAAADLERLIIDQLKEEGLSFESAESFSTPRRLTLVVQGVPASTPDVREERRGPKVDAPEKAIEGFLGSVGLTRDQVTEVEDKKGRYLMAVIERQGQPTAALLPHVVEQAVRNFPWPKSMRWGDGPLTWVRPLQNILCVFDGVAVAVAVDGVPSAAKTAGHRFMAPGPFDVNQFRGVQRGIA